MYTNTPVESMQGNRVYNTQSKGEGGKTSVPVTSVSEWKYIMVHQGLKYARIEIKLSINYRMHV